MGGGFSGSVPDAAGGGSGIWPREDAGAQVVTKPKPIGARSGIARYEDLLARHVLPLGVFTQIEGGYRPETIRGTSFVLGKNTVITCWHCVQARLPKGQTYGLAIRRDVYAHKYEEVVPLLDVAQASGGIDLAIARADVEVQPTLSLAREPLSYGADVVTIGYPLPFGAGNRFETSARLLRGYVTRIIQHNDPRWTPARAYELDMPAPGGLSGGPLVNLDTLQVHGVVLGVRDYEEPSEPEEAPRVHPFTVAYHLETLRAARSRTTDGAPLGEYVADE